jgi:hypothetical protein
MVGKGVLKDPKRLEKKNTIFFEHSGGGARGTRKLRVPCDLVTCKTLPHITKV